MLWHYLFILQVLLDRKYPFQITSSSTLFTFYRVATNLQLWSNHFCLPPSIIYNCPWKALCVFSLCQVHSSWLTTSDSHPSFLPSLESHPVPSQSLGSHCCIFPWSCSHPYSSLSLRMHLRHLLYRKVFMTVHSKVVLGADSMSICSESRVLFENYKSAVNHWTLSWFEYEMTSACPHVGSFELHLCELFGRGHRTFRSCV